MYLLLLAFRVIYRLPKEKGVAEFGDSDKGRYVLTAVSQRMRMNRKIHWKTRSGIMKKPLPVILITSMPEFTVTLPYQDSKKNVPVCRRC